MEIKLSDLWNVFKKVFLIMLIGGLVVGMFTYIFSNAFGKKAYSSSAQFFMDPNKDGIDVKDYTSYIVYCKENVKVLTKTELAMRNLLGYIDVMHAAEPENPDYILENVYSPGTLVGRCTITMAPGDYDASFTVTFTTPSSHDAMVLLKAYAATCNEQGSRVFGDNLAIKATVEGFRPGTQTSPHPFRNACIAFLLVALAVYFIAYLIAVLDTRLYNADDLKQHFGKYPILGQIPFVKEKEKTNEKAEEKAE